MMTADDINNLELVIKNTAKDFILIETLPQVAFHLEDSKIGGVPYWPESMPYPILNDVPGKLFVQINFSQLAEENIFLQDFPEKGILQFFFPYRDPYIGLSYDKDEKITQNIKVIYHENTNEIPLVNESLFNISYDDEDTPFETELRLIFHKGIDFLANDADCEFYEKYLKTSLIPKKYYENEELCELFKKYKKICSKINGYPHFVQKDYRRYKTDSKRLSEDWVLLLQIQSDENISIGDWGVANWFIKKDDLMNLNFNNVIFFWDCH